MSRVLLLPGLMATGELKKNALINAGFEVNSVAFDDHEVIELENIFKAPLRNLVPMASMLMKARRIYAAWVSEAQAAYDALQPDIIVGSSRGGSVAMTIRVDDQIPLVLLAPAYRWFGWIGGKTSTDHPIVTVVHSRHDERIPFADSEKLCRKCPQVKLVAAGIDHTLNSPDATSIWLKEVDRLSRAV